MSEFNQSENEKVKRMDKILEASQGKDEKELKEQDNPAADGEAAARQDRREANEEMLKKYGAAAYAILDRFMDSITAAMKTLDRAAAKSNLPDEAKEFFNLDQSTLDDFSDKLDDFIQEHDYDPGMLEVHLYDLGIDVEHNLELKKMKRQFMRRGQ